MADLALRMAVEGAQKATADIYDITKAIQNVATTDQEWVRIQENLTRASSEVRAEQEKRSKSLQDLKDRTDEAVKKAQEHIATEEVMQGAIGKTIEAISSYAGRLLGFTALIGGAVLGYKQMIDATKEAMENEIRLEAILQATGGTVGKTKDQLLAYAAAISSSTAINRQDIERAMSIMLTFGNVQGDVFDRGIKIAADYSKLLGVDLSSAARIVGRALEDPALGMGMLSRAIGQLEPQQKQQIKDFQDQGRVVEAQTYLLEILEKKMGGLADKMGGSSVSATQRLTNAWKEMLEEWGKTTGVVETQAASMGYLESVMKRLTALPGDIQWAMRQWRKSMLERQAAGEPGVNVTGDSSPESAQKELDAMAKKIQDRAVANVEATEKAVADAKVKAYEHGQDRLLATMQKRSQDDAEKMADLQKQIAQAYGVGNDPNSRGDVQIAAYERAASLERELDALRKSSRDKANSELMKRLADEEAYYKNLKILGEKSTEDIIELYKRQSQEHGLTTEQRTALEAKAHQARLQADADMERVHDQEMRRAQQQADQELKNFNEQAKQVRERQRLRSDDAQLELAEINKTAYWTRADKIAALEDLRRKYQELGQDGETALKKIDREMARMPTEADDAARQIKGIFGKLTFDTISVFGSIHSALSQQIAGIMKGTETLGQGIKGFFASMVDSVINELARLSANQILQWLMGSSGSEPVSGSIGGILGGVLQGVSGGGLGILSNFASLFSGGGGATAAGALGELGINTDLLAAGSLDAFASEFAASSFLGPAAFALPFLGGGGGIVQSITSGISDVISGIGDFFGGLFQTGTDQIVSRPTLMMVGEAGPERLKVSPMSGAGLGGGGGGVVVNVQGLSLMDNYSARRLAFEISRMVG